MNPFNKAALRPLAGDSELSPETHQRNIIEALPINRRKWRSNERKGPNHDRRELGLGLKIRRLTFLLTSVVVHHLDTGARLRTTTSQHR